MAFDYDALDDNRLAQLCSERAFRVFSLKEENVSEIVVKPNAEKFAEAREKLEERGYGEKDLRDYMIKYLEQDYQSILELIEEKVKCSACERFCEDLDIMGCSAGHPPNTEAKACGDFTEREDDWAEDVDAGLEAENEKRQDLITKLVEDQAIQIAIGLGPKIVEK